uniref:Hexosyltransferase n=1 Tax=Leptobrachium leishanense TaxID=445787 RepID=A0A8C5RAJ0_9ANUR
MKEFNGFANNGKPEDFKGIGTKCPSDGGSFHLFWFIFLKDRQRLVVISCFMEIREQARKLDMHLVKDNISKTHLIEPDACSGREVFLLTVVFSNPENKSRRERIRQTWGNVTAFKGRAVIKVFALGRPVSENTQSELEEEAQNHQDIVEGSFIDSYQNETLKMTMMIEWVVTFCPNARFILKTEENMFVNIKSLADHLLGLETQSEDLYLGRVIHQGIPTRDPQSPNFVPLTSYSETYYPDYCSGAAMVLSQDVTRKVYLVSDQVSTLLPSDVFVGICAQRAGVLSIHSARFSGSRHVSYNRCCYKFIFSSSGNQWDESNKGLVLSNVTEISTQGGYLCRTAHCHYPDPNQPIQLPEFLLG